jgi:CBS domain-containing protein
MRASDVLRDRKFKVQTILPTRSVQEAINQLVVHGIGSLLVEDETSGDIIGIITERDILKECARRSQLLDETPVHEVMTKKLIVGRLDDKVTHLLELMTNHRVRHLPIMKDDRLEGLLSIGDLVKAQLDQMAMENQHLKEYIQGGAAVSP